MKIISTTLCLSIVQWFKIVNDFLDNFCSWLSQPPSDFTVTSLLMLTLPLPPQTLPSKYIITKAPINSTADVTTTTHCTPQPPQLHSLFNSALITNNAATISALSAIDHGILSDNNFTTAVVFLPHNLNTNITIAENTIWMETLGPEHF